MIVTLNKKQLKVPVYSLLCLLTHGAGSPTIPNNPVLQSHFPLVSERSQKEKKNERGRQKRAERVRNRKGRRGYCVRGKKRRRNRETASSVGETETPAKLVGHAEHANDGIQLDRPIFTPLLCPSNNQQTQRDTRLKLTTHGGRSCHSDPLQTPHNDKLDTISSLFLLLQLLRSLPLLKNRHIKSVGEGSVSWKHFKCFSCRRTGQSEIQPENKSAKTSQIPHLGTRLCSTSCEVIV